MTRTAQARLTAALAGLAAAVALSACGRVGMLDQPGPLYGEKAKAAWKAKQDAAAAAAKADQDSDKPEPLAPDTPGLHDGGQDPSSLGGRDPGSYSAPTAAPPPGALPDPTLRPR